MAKSSHYSVDFQIKMGINFEYLLDVVQTWCQAIHLNFFVTFVGGGGGVRDGSR